MGKKKRVDNWIINLNSHKDRLVKTHMKWSKIYWRWTQSVDQRCPQSCMDAHMQSVLFPVVRCFMVMGNKMAACLSPWPAAEPATVDTTTRERDERRREPSNYTWPCSINKNLNLLISMSGSDPEFLSLLSDTSCEESVLGVRHDVMCFAVI